MKALRFFLLTAVTLLALASCDFYPVVVTVSVTDEDGHDRLNPESEYFIGENISAVYEGEVYPMQKMFADAATKVYMPCFFGLEWRKDDGTSDTVHTKHIMFTPLAIVNTWHLNGKKVSPPITLVK